MLFFLEQEENNKQTEGEESQMTHVVIEFSRMVYSVMAY
jgi:hypothetical protein